MVKIKITASMFVNGEVRSPGDIVEVEQGVANRLVFRGRAEFVKDTKTEKATATKAEKATKK